MIFHSIQVCHRLLRSSRTCCLWLGRTDFVPIQPFTAIFENYVAEIRLDGKPVQLALWDTAYVPSNSNFTRTPFFPFFLPSTTSSFPLLILLLISFRRGQEEYEQLRPLSYAKSHVILIAFAIDTPDTLENVITKWISEVRLHCGNHVPVILVGCKSDLRPPHINSSDSSGSNASGLSTTNANGDAIAGTGSYVTTEQGRQVAQQIGAREYRECSALKVEGVDDVFEAATRASMLIRDHGRGKASAGGAGRRQRQSRRDDEESGGCCVIA
jgi:Rho family, other